MTPWFEDLGFPLPPVRISAGFPSTGHRGRNTAEAWSEDGGTSFVIFVRPDSQEPYWVAAALAQELARIAAGPKDGYGHLFKHIAISIGLRGTKKQSLPGLRFKKLINPALDKAGPLPIAAREPARAARTEKQKTRMLKVWCPQCGYVARVSRKWLDEVGEPLCPRHEQMEIAD